MTFKKIIGKLHLWLGLSSGLVVFILSVTGCIYAFQEEIQDLTQSYRYTAVQNQAALLPTVLREIAEKQLPGKEAHSVKYNNNGRSAEVVFFKADSYYYKTFINQYTGEVLKVKDMDTDFFRFILMGHFYLWLPPTIGQPVVATATLIFVGLMISGMILWWPKSKKGFKQRFSIKWNAKGKRKNYDLHNVLGFYIISITLILALTGLVWGFQWFTNSVYYVTSGGKQKTDFYEATSDTTKITATINQLAVNNVWNKMKVEHSNAACIEVHFPHNTKSAIEVAIKPEAGLFWNTDFIYLDQYTLAEIDVNHIWGRLHNAQFADKLHRMNYDIHTGAILGLPGKILAFGISLICASLPITGFLIWWGRKKKYKKNKKGKKMSVFEEMKNVAIY